MPQYLHKPFLEKKIVSYKHMPTQFSFSHYSIKMYNTTYVVHFNKTAYFE